MKKLLKEQPIFLPQNPYWEVFKRFGRDELIALIINIGGTALMAFLLTKMQLEDAVKISILAVTGPVIEKIGFFPAHFWEAFRTWKSLKGKKNRKRLRHYIKIALKGGSKSLLEDILIHDPIYILLMVVGLSIIPNAPEWILAFLSFVIAVALVSVVEVMYNEIMYILFIKRKKKKGFGLERYYESRFVIEKTMSSEKILQMCSDEFNVGKIYDINYEDTYFEPKLQTYSGREATIKIRNRDSLIEESNKVNTLQIIYTRPNEIKRDLSQHRYFISRKDKLYKKCTDADVNSLDDIKDEKIKKCFMKHIDSSESINLKFNRKLVRDKKGLLFSVDELENDKKHIILEIKVYKNKLLLKEAMKYVMINFPVIQTTHNKFSIFIKNT